MEGVEGTVLLQKQHKGMSFEIVFSVSTLVLLKQYVPDMQRRKVL